MPTTFPGVVNYDRLFEFEGTVEAVFREELNRDVDRSGRAAGVLMAMQGRTADDLRAWVRSSDEYRALHPDQPPTAPPPSGQVSAQGPHTTFPVDVTYERLFEFEGTVESIFREELNRDVDRSGRAAGVLLAMQGKTADDLRAWVRSSDEYRGLHDQKPLPPPPSRLDVLSGQITAQGLIVHTSQYGDMPWWPACWPWLSPATRAEVAPQLLAAGDTIIAMQRPSGLPLYDEPNQFYSADRFGPLSMSDADVRDLVIETIGYGFKAVWIFLGGDDGQRGFPIACAQTEALGPVLANSPVGDLNAYTAQVPGWDGVWHKPGPDGTGYNPPQLQEWSERARRAGAKYLLCEGGTGYMLCGEGGDDWKPGGHMYLYDGALLEFGDDQFTGGDVWQILARYFGPAYHRPPEQDAHDHPGDPLYDDAHDPGPPHVLKTGSDRGPFVARVFEYRMYGFVRDRNPALVAAAKQRFQSMVPSAVIC